MRKLARTFEELDFSKLMEVYSEGNRENGAYFYPDETPERQMELAKREFERYLREDFFTKRGATHWVWDEDGRYLSALRLEPWQDGYLLEALETHPDYRQRHYARNLICAVLEWFPAETKIYSQISKTNIASIATHIACGFYRLLDYSVDADGQIHHDQLTMTVDVY